MRFSETIMPVKKKKKYRFSNFGFSTILLTFVMMCIMTFGVLSLVTANSDYKLSKKTAEKASGYAEARETSYTRLSKLDEILQEIYSTNPTEENYETLVMEALEANDLSTFLVSPSEEDTDLSMRLHWEIPTTDTQHLSVTVKLYSLSEISSSFYEIEEWETAHTESSAEVIDDTWHLMGSD